MDTFKPCPFCGTEFSLLSNCSYSSGSYGATLDYTCPGCRVNFILKESRSNGVKTSDTITSKWNRRTHEKQPSQEGE